MRLIHLDEAGTSCPSEGAYMVVAGVITEPDVHHKDINDDMYKLVYQAMPERNADFNGFHATDLFKGTAEVFKGKKLQETLPIIKGIIAIMERHKRGVVYGLCDRNR